MRFWFLFLLAIVSLPGGTELFGQGYPGIPTEPKPGDRMLAEYFERQTRQLTEACLAEIETAEDWQRERGKYREQLFEMLGIPPRKQRTELQAEVTGSQQHEGVHIENVVFQSLPGLYVTANFYLPIEEEAEPYPAVLYVCGHSRQKEGEISFGNKTAYHHHGMWFARNGYACLTIDTIQLGEIEGLHHGTYREGRWWWNSRGYSPAGVEAWNGIRALDYLQSRPEVDGERIGMTGRSGGGAYSWWVSALDERIKVSVPVAGITSLHNHVVDGVVEGHCDCMYHVNTYRWDFPAVAALVAPRPLLIANTDKDTIFPLDGVVDVYQKTRRIYRLLGAEQNIGLAISEGPHKDTQPLRTEAFHWFERHLKGRAAADEVDTVAAKVLDRTTMRALDRIPADEMVTLVDHGFVEMAPAPELPENAAAWEEISAGWMTALREKVFRGWPEEGAALELKEVAREASEFRGELLQFEFTSETPVRLPLVLALPPDARPDKVSVHVVDESGWQEYSKQRFDPLRLLAVSTSYPTVLVAPRGIGPTAWTDDVRERVQVRRRHMLIGQTLDGMRVWDLCRAMDALAEIENVRDRELVMIAGGKMATNVLFASLFRDGIAGLNLAGLDESLRAGGPDYLNVLRYLDVPAALAMSVERHHVRLFGARAEAWEFVSELSGKLRWETRLDVFQTAGE